MRLQELVDKLNEFVLKNPDSKDVPIYFDSEAQKFNHHLISLDFVYLEDDRVIFHEDHPHRGHEDMIYKLGETAFNLLKENIK